MFKKIKKTNSEGFTIIEIMIVLAVAALILLIVLLAVPALQRNSRNTTIKNDAASLAGGINTFESDNGGSTPTSITANAGKVTIANGTCAAPGATVENTNINGSTTINCQVAIPAAQIPASTLYVMSGKTCPNNLVTTGTPGAPTTSSRSVAIYYSIEVSGTVTGLANECVSS